MLSSASSNVQIRLRGAIVERNSFTGGETLSGIVIISSKNKKAILTRSITILLTGREKVSLDESEIGSHIGMTGKVEVKVESKTYSERSILINRYVTLLGAKLGEAAGSDIMQLNFDGTATTTTATDTDTDTDTDTNKDTGTDTGTSHHFPFRFVLPSVLPGAMSAGGSFYNTYGCDVRYNLQVRVDIPRGWTGDSLMNMSVPIRGNYLTSARVMSTLLLDYVNPTVAAAVQIPVAKSKATAVTTISGIASASGSKAFMGSVGRLHTMISLPCKALVLNTCAPQYESNKPVAPNIANISNALTISIINDSTIALSAIRIQLVSQVTVTAEGHSTTKDGNSILLCIISSVSGPVESRVLLDSIAGSAVDKSKGSENLRQVILSLQVPLTVWTTHKSNRIITSHTLVVEVIPQGWIHLPLVVKLPIEVLAPPMDMLINNREGTGSGTGTGTGTGLVTAMKTPFPLAYSSVQATATANAPDSTVPPSSIHPPTHTPLAKWLTILDSDDVASALIAINAKGNIHHTTPKGHTVLHLACLRSQPTLCQLLINAGANIFAVTEAGFTPLHSAAYGGCEKTCAVILQAAALKAHYVASEAAASAVSTTSLPISVGIKGDALYSMIHALTNKGSTAAKIALYDLSPVVGSGGEMIGGSPKNDELAMFITHWQWNGDGDGDGEKMRREGRKGKDKDKKEKQEGDEAEDDGDVSDAEGEHEEEMSSFQENTGKDEGMVDVTRKQEKGSVIEGGSQKPMSAPVPESALIPVHVPASSSASAATSTSDPGEKEQNKDKNKNKNRDKVMKWQSDNDSYICNVCETLFTFFNRRHHCRQCGLLVCGTCAPMNERGERVCTNCKK